jgi:uncharacterized protein YkwD
MRIDARIRSQDGGAGQVQVPMEPKKSSGWGALALIIVALLLVLAFIYVAPGLPGAILKAGSTLFQSNSETNASQTFEVISPLIQNGSANITYPPTYNTVSNYALGLVNQDRANFSLGPVTLSPNQAGQQHADSMLSYGYFSHYDTQGYKPYMRYTLLAGTGAVFENVAYISYSNLHYTTVGAVEGSLKTLEYSMMYNDSACCANGHRLNILNPLHNRVSIGVAYNSTTLFFDEDFENYYVNMTVSTSNSYTVTMRGEVLDPTVVSKEAFIAYDPTPVAETPATLNNGPHEYDPGTIVGGILPCASLPPLCEKFATGITVYATTWDFTTKSMMVSFSLSDFVNQNGPGVYTVYLVTGTDTSSAISSYSVFVG